MQAVTFPNLPPRGEKCVSVLQPSRDTIPRMSKSLNRTKKITENRCKHTSLALSALSVAPERGTGQNWRSGTLGTKLALKRPSGLLGALHYTNWHSASLIGAQPWR
ncbi:hypothetical protein LR48_Vigan10g181500 [Vigna angularis]|uniref:Uncharacterized protein n=1 Tax=Phaseolus angularis TaxID=3914 RepID=A0A0L9VLQ8_PHAAN|nr:hypothetical protein LR48_Vigan10g181500 [Vigna angularis]